MRPALHAYLAARLLPGSWLTWLDLVEQTTREAGADLDDVLWGRRLAAAVRARQHAWGALRGAGYSYPTIARAWGMDHATVMHGVRQAEKRLTAERGVMATEQPTRAEQVRAAGERAAELMERGDMRAAHEAIELAARIVWRALVEDMTSMPAAGGELLTGRTP